MPDHRLPIILTYNLFFYGYHSMGRLLMLIDYLYSDLECSQNFARGCPKP